MSLYFKQLIQIIAILLGVFISAQSGAVDGSLSNSVGLSGETDAAIQNSTAAQFVELNESAGSIKQQNPVSVENSNEISKKTTTNESTIVEEPLAVTWYREKAENGDMDAQFNLAMIYETGFGVNIDEETALKWYSIAAKQGHSEAQLKLGMLYILGLGAKENTLKGGKWIRSASRSGSAFAAFIVDKLLTEHLAGLELKDVIAPMRVTYNLKDADTAKAEFLEILALAETRRAKKPKKERFTEGVTGSAAKKGTVGNRVPDFLAETKQKTEIVTEDNIAQLRQLAKDGNADAQYDWGKELEIGELVPVDKMQAVKWYTEAALQGHSKARYRLAVAYIYGVGIDIDSRQGGELLKQSAEQRYPLAEKLQKYLSTNKGRMIGYGTTIVLPWRLEHAMEMNDGESMLALSHMFHNGWGVERSPEEGKFWMRKAKSAGSRSLSRQMRRMRVAQSLQDVDSSPVETDPVSVDTDSSIVDTNTSSDGASTGPASVDASSSPLNADFSPENSNSPPVNIAALPVKKAVSRANKESRILDQSELSDFFRSQSQAQNQSQDISQNQSTNEIRPRNKENTEAQFSFSNPQVVPGQSRLRSRFSEESDEADVNRRNIEQFVRKYLGDGKLDLISKVIMGLILVFVFFRLIRGKAKQPPASRI